MSVYGDQTPVDFDELISLPSNGYRRASGRKKRKNLLTDRCEKGYQFVFRGRTIRCKKASGRIVLKSCRRPQDLPYLQVERNGV